MAALRGALGVLEKLVDWADAHVAVFRGERLPSAMVAVRVDGDCQVGFAGAFDAYSERNANMMTVRGWLRRVASAVDDDGREVEFYVVSSAGLAALEDARRPAAA